jgi:hypothetical protein
VIVDGKGKIFEDRRKENSKKVKTTEEKKHKQRKRTITKRGCRQKVYSLFD